MSLAFEEQKSYETPIETAYETHELVAWFSDPQKALDEPMPALSPLTVQRLGDQLGTDPAFDFMIAMTNLYKIKSEELRQAVYQYICGYSGADLELLAPNIEVTTMKEIVESWTHPQSTQINSDETQTPHKTRSHLSDVSAKVSHVSKMDSVEAIERPKSRPLVNYSRWTRPNAAYVLKMVNPDLIRSPDWMMKGACSEEGVDLSIFEAQPRQRNTDPEEHEKALQAVNMCGRCAVRSACLTDAIVNKDNSIIRGGFIPRQLSYLIKEYYGSTAMHTS